MLPCESGVNSTLESFLKCNATELNNCHETCTQCIQTLKKCENIRFGADIKCHEFFASKKINNLKIKFLLFYFHQR